MLRRISQKTYTVILIFQFVLMGMFLIYGFVQRTQAVKNQELAVDAKRMAEENEKKAIEVLQELDNCRNSK